MRTIEKYDWKGNRMDIQSIETFLQVVSLENFTRAAEELNFAQSTVTAQIQRLEQELGYPLFERIGRKSYLTAAGREFLPHAIEILQLMQRVTALGQDPQQIHGTLRLGVLESLLFSVTLKVLPAFCEQYPNINVEIKLGQAYEILLLLKQNKIDLAYISYDLIGDPALSCCYRRKEEMVFTASYQHALAGRRAIPLGEALSMPFIVTEPSGRCYERLHEIAASHNVALYHAIGVDNIRAIIELLQDGRSISFLPRYSVAEYSQNQKISVLDVDIPPQIYYSQIVYHKNKWLSTYMEYFIGLVRQMSPDMPD